MAIHGGLDELSNFCLYLGRGLASFVGVNILVIVPLAFVLSVCVPQKFEIDVEANGGVAVAVATARLEDGTVNYCSSVELYDQESSGISAHVFGGEFPRSFDFSSPALFIRSSVVTNLFVGSMRMVVGDLFCKTLSPSELSKAYQIDGMKSVGLSSNGMVNLELPGGSCRLEPARRLEWGAWEFSPHGEIFDLSSLYLFIGLELLTLIVSLITAYFRSRNLARDMHPWQTLSIAAITVYFYFYVVPLQSYFANAADYPFSPGQLLLGVLPCSIVAFLVVSMGLYLSGITFGRIAHFAVFAFLVYEYLESGILSQGAPLFIGDASYYSDSGLLQRDLFVLVYVFIFVMLPYPKLKAYFSWMLVVLFVMLSASLLDVKCDTRFVMDKQDSSAWDCVREKVPFHVKYSNKRNIIVFVVDSVTTEVAHDVVSGNAPLMGSFSGFTAFDNNLGGQHQSDLSTVCIFTGEYYQGRDNRASAHNFVSRATMDGSLLLDYLNSPFHVYCMAPTYVFGHGYASGCDKRLSKSESPLGGCNPFFWRPAEMLSLSVLNLSLFRVTPFMMKLPMSRWVCPFFGFAEEEYVYPMFRSAPLEELPGVFLYCHTHGVHVPHDVSSDGVRRGTLIPSYAANFDHTKAVFAELAKTLDAFKERGVYDCSTILVIADHGSHVNEDAKCLNRREDALPARAFPMLWAKPANSHGPIVFDETTPTTHANLHKVLRTLKDKDMTADEIAAMLSSDRRIFIQQTRDGYDQWEVAPDGTVMSKVHKEGN